MSKCFEATLRVITDDENNVIRLECGGFHYTTPVNVDNAAHDAVRMYNATIKR